MFYSIKVLACLVRKCTKGSCVLAVLTATSQATVSIPQLFLEFMENMLNIYSLWIAITISFVQFMKHSHTKKALHWCCKSTQHRAHLKITEYLLMAKWFHVGEHRSLLFPVRDVWYIFCLLQSYKRKAVFGLHEV